MMASPPTGRRNVRKGSNSQNIKVFVRCRPLNSIEKNSKSFSCIDVQNNREVVVKERPLDKFTKTFSFDRVFGPEAKQIDVYKAVAKNSVEEVLNGFNCTIFAYGQTGTGKTFTMEGDRTPDNTSWDDDPMAGIIPRCVNHLFDELRIQKLEFTMRVSFLELYNEELFDLLSPNDDMSKLRLYEDASRKGSCIIQGLEEVLVRSKANVYEVLEKGSNKRQTAATLMNAHSSRSHTVFTVTLHIKENTVDGDELLRTGKLHLVDLAGSENIGRSGAVDKRAREAGSINMSLLTLGRVITALVEKTPHVPYRESKLTRLLQDALGGRTKTSIIATISPASVNLEETLSTLDYAHRAKNIQNKPEVNQKLNKKELIGEYSQEIERLRLDLMAMREKNGVYLANENYQEMIQTMESQAQEIMEKINYIRSLEEGIEQKTNDLNTANTKLDELALQLNEMKDMLRDTKEVLSCTQKLLHQTSVDRDEQKYLVSAHVKTEEKLLSQGKVLVELAGTTTGDLSKLHDKIDRKRNVEDSNMKIGQEFQGSYEQSLEKMRELINNGTVQQKEAIDSISSQFGGSVSQCKEEISSLISQWKSVSQNHMTFFNELHILYKERTKEELASTRNFCEDRLSDAKTQKNQLKKFEETLFLPAMEKLASLISTEATLMSSMHKCVTDKLNDLDKKCEVFVNQQNDVVTNNEGQMLKLLDSFSTTVSSCRTTCDVLYGSVDQKCKDLEFKTREMEKLLASFKEIGQALEVDVSKTKETLPKSLSLLEATTGSAKDQLKNFSGDLINSNNSYLSYIRTHVSDTKAVVEEQNTQMERNVQHLGEQRCGLESIISQHVNDTNIFWNTQHAEIVRYKECVQTSFEKSLQEHSAHVERAVTDIENDREKLCSSLEGESLRLEKDLSLLKEQCNTTTANLLKHTENYSSQLDIQKKEVLELFSEKMIQDIPTGETPVRKEYKFSRLLSSTSPHDRLLERYRQGSASTLSKIPLPSYGEDTEEEVASPSFESSIMSSDSSQVEEENFETRSLSSSVSDMHSNSGSLSDLRSKNGKDTFAVPNRPAQYSRENSGIPLSRSSSTSSIPETKDKENSSSMHKGSTKKRGLRPQTEKSSIPEASNSRSRRVLGMQN